MTNDRKTDASRDSVISSSDFKYVLDTNAKAIEIHLEVEKQNEEIIELLDNQSQIFSKLKEELDLLHQKNTKLQDTIDDDVDRNFSTVIDSLKNITLEIKNLSVEIKDLKLNDAKLKDSIDSLVKLVDSELKSKITSIENSIFKLVIILGSAGVGTIFTFISNFFHK